MNKLLSSVFVVAALCSLTACDKVSAPSAAKTGTAAAGTKSNGMNVVATVDGYNITEAELAPMMQQGADRAVALDRRITQSAIAKKAEKDYAQEAEVLLAANRNDILYQLYLTKRTQEIKKAITEADISAFYTKNVKDEDFKKVSLKVFLTSDAREAQSFYENFAKAIESKSTEPLAAKMTYLNKEGDHLLPLQSVPYNLGQLIKKMKAGDILQPIVIREGVLVVYVESFKESPKPTLDATKEEIRGLLLNERLGTEVQSIRKAASINLKG